MNRQTTPFTVGSVLFKAGRLGPAIVLVLAVAVAWAGDEQHQIDAPPRQSPIGSGGVWPSEPPADCPFKPSPTLTGLRFTGRHAEYTGADTWYPSWASDGNLYSPWTDGNVNGLNSGSGGKDASTGHAKIVGDDPLKLQIVEQGVYKSSPAPTRAAIRAAASSMTESGTMAPIACIRRAPPRMPAPITTGRGWVRSWASVTRPTSARPGRNPPARRPGRCSVKPHCGASRSRSERRTSSTSARTLNTRPTARPISWPMARPTAAIAASPTIVGSPVTRSTWSAWPPASGTSTTPRSTSLRRTRERARRRP